MKISEYVLLERAFDDSFGFMLNRMEDTSLDGKSMLAWRPEYNGDKYLSLRERCFDEFILAVEENGIKLEEIHCSCNDNHDCEAHRA